MHLAIRESIAREIDHERRKAEDPIYADTHADFDPVPEISRQHVEESMNGARRSVGPADIRKYEMFATSLQQARAFGAAFKFDESAPAAGGRGGQPSAPADDANDLYA